MSKSRVASIMLPLVIIILSGCAAEPTYDESLAMRPDPKTKDEVVNECGWIRGEIGKQQSYINNYSNTPTSTQSGINLGAIYARVAPQRIASLESRAANIGCRAAFANNAGDGQSKIQQCILACKENTKRSSDVCFDSCNK